MKDSVLAVGALVIAVSLYALVAWIAWVDGKLARLLYLIVGED